MRRDVYKRLLVAWAVVLVVWATLLVLWVWALL